jgi:RNA polymerase sigma-70 factor (ECF subfamily)
MGNPRDASAVMGRHADLDIVLDKILRGEPDAFGQVVRAYELPLRSYLASYIYNLDDVDDVAQEVLLTAFRGLSSYRRGDDFGAWLRGIARNKLYNYFRSASRRTHALQGFREEVTRLVESDLERTAAEDRTEVIERLLGCIAKLPERQRRVVRAGLNGDRPADLARELQITIGAVYNLHHRANQLLRDCLQKERS